MGIEKQNLANDEIRYEKADEDAVRLCRTAGIQALKSNKLTLGWRLGNSTPDLSKEGEGIERLIEI